MRFISVLIMIWCCRTAQADKLEYLDDRLLRSEDQDTVQHVVFRFTHDAVFRGAFEVDSNRIMIAMDSVATAEGKTEFILVNRKGRKNRRSLIKLEKTAGSSFSYNKKNGKVIFNRPDGIYSFNLVKDGKLVQSENPVVELVKACAGCNRPEWVDEKKYKYKKIQDGAEVEFIELLEAE